MLNLLKIRVFNLIIDYKIPDLVFVRIANIFFLLKGKSYRFRVSIKKIETEPKYEIIDFITQDTKKFNFRKQGIMAFKDGISKRGDIIGNAYMLNNIQFNDKDIIFDIGANTGDLFIYFNNHNKAINYFGFEPGIMEYKCLQQNVKSDNLHQIAIGNTNSEKDFFYNPEFGDSSLIKMKGYESSYKVKVLTLSTFIKDNLSGNTKIKLLKLEAEGFEPEILEGISDDIIKIEYISADLGFERGYKQDTTLPTATNFLFSKGFKIIDINQHRLTVLFKNTKF